MRPRSVSPGKQQMVPGHNLIVGLSSCKVTISPRSYGIPDSKPPTLLILSRLTRTPESSRWPLEPAARDAAPFTGKPM